MAVKPKRLIIWPFTAEVCQALIYTISSGLFNVKQEFQDAFEKF